MTDKQFYGCALCFIALAISVILLSPTFIEQPKPQGVETASVNSSSPKKESMAIAPTTPQALDSQHGPTGTLVISYEGAGMKGTLQVFRFQVGKQFAFNPSVTDLVTKNGYKFSTHDLAKADDKSKIWWLTTDLRSNKQSLYLMDTASPGQQVNGFKVRHSQRVFAMSDGRAALWQPSSSASQIEIISQNNQAMRLDIVSNRFPQESSFSIAQSPISKTILIGDISNRAVHIVPDKSTTTMHLKLKHPVIIPQSIAMDGDRWVIFGVTKNKELSYNEFNPGLLPGRILQGSPPVRSVFISHAFIRKNTATLFCGDAPDLLEFDLRSGKQTNRIPLKRFCRNAVGATEADRAIKLEGYGCHYAFTITTPDEQTHLVIAYGDKFWSTSVSGTSNGLATSGRWLAWDVRGAKKRHADKVVIIDLKRADPSHEFSQHWIPLGISTGNRPFPSTMVVFSQ